MNIINLKHQFKWLFIVTGIASLVKILVGFGAMAIMIPWVYYAIPTTAFYLVHLGLPETDKYAIYVFFGYCVDYFLLLFLVAELFKRKFLVENLTKIRSFFDRHLPLFETFINDRKYEENERKKIYVLQEVTDGYPNQPRLYSNENEAEAEYIQLAYYFAISCLGPRHNIKPFESLGEAVNFLRSDKARSKGYKLTYWTLDQPGAFNE